MSEEVKRKMVAITLRGYESICVFQRNTATGCIPAAIEWALRYKKILGINLDQLQEQFDLQKRGVGNNDFNSVVTAIATAYPQKFWHEYKAFPQGHGSHKMDYIAATLSAQVPCLMSIALCPEGGWHIVPVVEVDHGSIKVLWLDQRDVKGQLRIFERADMSARHDNWNGGQDVLAFP